MMFAYIKVFFLSSKIVVFSYKLDTNENHSIARLKCVGINVNYIIFFQPYETSSVITIT